jgi:tRNA(Ile)-lysidine synthase
LCNWCQKHEISHLAVAHHLLDQAETFLMRLQRGSGLFGLSSIQDISTINDISVIRPLLYTHPDLLKDYLRQKNLSWVEDESNHCTDFLRVKMRQFLPTFSAQTTITPERLCEAVQQLQKTRSFIEDTVAQTISDFVHFWHNAGCSLDYAAFMDFHDELKFYVLRQLFITIGKDNYAPEASAVETLINQLCQPDFSSATLGHVYIQKSDLRLWFIRETRRKDKDLSEAQWLQYCAQNPFVRGIKIPHKLKLALFFEKNTKK